MRAIDADDLAKKVAYSREIPANAVCDVIELIESAPTIETPDKGEWEEPFERNGKKYHKCNHCHISSELILIDKFCPNCGASMKTNKTERNCEQCEHLKPKAPGVYGCELWECIKT